ncbi:MAG TPA: NTP transferase domain-containing protein [Streptosporangiaceae bacterium]|jgi:molybdopterin-guanine dinucleotide biosynthesis protein A
MTAGSLDAIVLAGGVAARLGGIDKPGLVIGTASLLAAVAGAAAGAGARRIIVVGPERPGVAELIAAAGGQLMMTREDPPGAGPVPALRAGLALAEASWVALLAGDMPFLRPGHLRDLLDAAGYGPDNAAPGDRRGRTASGKRPTWARGAGEPAGAVLLDDEGQRQWLAGCWRTAVLRAALADYDGRSLRGLLGPLEPTLVRSAAGDGAPPWLDCDTPADVAAARAWTGDNAAAGCTAVDGAAADGSGG